MARIPIANELGNVSARTPAIIARVSTPQLARPKRQVPSFSGINIGSDISALGRSVSEIGSILEKKQRQDNVIGVVSAEAHQKTKLLETTRNLENDPDYATYGERFDKQAAKFDQDAANLIRDPELREKWQVQASVRTATARDEVLRAGVKKDREAKRVKLLEALESHQDIYVAPGSDSQKVQARADMQAALTAAERSGLISPSQRLSLEQKFVDGSLKIDGETQLRNDPIGLKADLQGKGTFQRWLEKRESSDNPAAVNRFGFAGLYQFGAPRLVDLGFYKSGKGETVKGDKWTGPKWSGTFDIPGHPDVKTIADFLGSVDAQRTAFASHVQLMDREIARSKLDRFEGQVVSGVKITRESLYAMIHLAGSGGAKRALESGFADNPADAFGTTAQDYAAQAGSTSRYGDLDPLVRARLNEAADVRINRARKLQLTALEKQRKDLNAIRSPTEPRKKIDPSAYVQTYDREAAQASATMNAALSDNNLEPVDIAGIVDTEGDKILAAQARSGVASNNRKLLSNDQAKVLVQRLDGASQDSLVQEYLGIKARFGRHWPRVFGEMVEQGAPADYQVLHLVDSGRDGDLSAMNAVSEVARIQEKDLRSEAGTEAREVEKEMLIAVEDDIADFMSAYAIGGSSAQGAAIRDVVRKVALNTFRKTRDANTAREFAVNLIDERYTTVVGSNARVLMPNTDAFTERDLERAMERRQTEAALREFEPVIGSATARRNAAGEQIQRPEGVGPDLDRSRALQNAVREGIWITNPGGDGVMLMHFFGGGLLPVKNAAGETYDIPFEDVPFLASARNRDRISGVVGDVEPTVPPTLAGRALQEARAQARRQSSAAATP